MSSIIVSVICLPFYAYVLFRLRWLIVVGRGTKLSRVSQRTSAHGSFLIRRQRGHPGVVLPLVISNSAHHYEGGRVESSPIRNKTQLETSHV